LLDRGAEVNAVTKYDRFTPLHRAAQYGHAPVITLLLVRGAAVDGGWNAKELRPPLTPLHFAVSEGQLDAARLLLARGAKVDAARRGLENTPLHDATERGDLDMVKLLIRNGADPKQKGPLALALQSGRQDLIQLFVAKGADFNADPDLLLSAAVSRKKEVVELVLAKGFNVVDADNRGMWALVYAAREGHTDIVRLLLEKGVDPNIIGKAYTVPLHVAATKEIAELLLKHRAKVDEPDKQGTPPMLAAVLRHNEEVAELLESHGAKHTLETLAALGRDDELRARLKKEPLKRGPPPKGADPERPTPLHLAAAFGQITTARVLIDAGADVNAAGPMGETPLHAAARRGHQPLVELLVEHKADVNAKMREPAFSVRATGRTTPLTVALGHGHADVARFLAKSGGLPAIDAKNAAALLPGAAAAKHWAIVRLLIEQGAPPETKLPPASGTALHLAAEAGDLDMVKWLVARKLDLKALDQQGWTPLTRAASAGRADVAKFLLSQGAKVGDGDLFRAAASGHVALVELLLAGGANRDAVSDYNRYTALGHAAEAGQSEVVKFLHGQGASVKKDVGVLHAAAFRGHREVVAFLLDKGVDVEEFRPDGFHLYYWAFPPRRPSVVAFFAETDRAKFVQGQNTGVMIEEVNGGKPFVVTGGRPLQAAVAGRQKAIAALLLDRGASAKVLFPDGSTVLHLAAALGDAEMAELLLKRGTPVDARDKNGRSALAVAVQRDEEDVAALLRKHGAKE
jgi:ankyrin repeat protein